MNLLPLQRIVGSRMMLATVLVWLISCLFTFQSAMAQEADKVNFETRIKPLLEKHCLRCHGPGDEQGDFRIDDRETVMSGYVDPGDALFSDLYLSVISDDEDELMPPPDEGGPLPREEAELIKNWIDQGAEWPDGVELVLDEKVVEEVKEEIVEEQKKEDASADNLKLITEILAQLHPVILHFPVALLMGGALFALLGFRGESPLADAAYYCLWLGAWMAIFACVSGWFFAVDKAWPDWQTQQFDISDSKIVHRWGAIVISVFAFVLALMAASSRRRDPYGTGAVWKLGMIVLAVLTGFVAHHGGKLTHKGLHDKLLNKSNQLYQNLTGEEKKAPAANADVEEPSDEKSTDADDKASVEAPDDDDSKGEAAPADPSDADTGEGNAETSDEDNKEESDDGS